MRRFGGIVVLILISLFAGTSVSQDLSHLVLPSEDELLEALRGGDVSLDQYIRLKEILSAGVDSSSLYLLDDVPNLVYFRNVPDSAAASLEAEQQRRVIRNVSRGMVNYRYVTLLEEDERHWYRTGIDIRLADRYRLVLKVNRESSGVERITDRSISYTNPRGSLRRLTAGSFTARPGLGTAFGYRGKLLDLSDQLSGESVLMPDQGGYNGVLSEWTTGEVECDGLVSLVRDSEYRMASVGLSISRNRGRFHPGAVLGCNQLTNRITGAEVRLPVVGVFQDYRYRRGSVSAEASVQSGRGRANGALVVEGRHTASRAEIRYAGWTYGDHLVELTTGSKAGSLTDRDTIGAVDFVYSTRRAGQTGALVKTVLELGKSLTLSSGLLSAEKSRSNATRQISAELDQALGSGWQLELDYLGKWRRHLTESSVADQASHRASFGVRFASGALWARAYIAVSAEGESRGFMSWFTDLRYQLPDNGQIEIWSSLSRLRTSGIERWYAFVRASQNLMDHLVGAAKLAHTYGRSAGEAHQSTLSFELTAML